MQKINPVIKKMADHLYVTGELLFRFGKRECSRLYHARY